MTMSSVEPTAPANLAAAFPRQAGRLSPHPARGVAPVPARGVARVKKFLGERSNEWLPDLGQVESLVQVIDADGSVAERPVSAVSDQALQDFFERLMRTPWPGDR